MRYTEANHLKTDFLLCTCYFSIMASSSVPPSGGNGSVSGFNPFVMPPASWYEKPEKFNGTDFKHWQHKMLFYLTMLNLAKFLKEECPAHSKENAGDAGDKEVQIAIDSWKHADFLC